MRRRFRKQRVLCVDDEVQLLQAVARQLQQEFTVITANSGEEALTLLHEGLYPHAIITDIQMPGMDGLTFLERATELVPDAVRLVLTGFGDRAVAVDAINRGRVSRFLHKPCKGDELRATVREALHERTLLSIAQDF